MNLSNGVFLERLDLVSQLIANIKKSHRTSIYCYHYLELVSHTPVEVQLVTASRQAT